MTAGLRHHRRRDNGLIAAATGANAARLYRVIRSSKPAPPSAAGSTWSSFEHDLTEQRDWTAPLFRYRWDNPGPLPSTVRTSRQLWQLRLLAEAVAEALPAARSTDLPIVAR
jgi:hypothetical protein